MSATYHTLDPIEPTRSLPRRAFGLIVRLLLWYLVLSFGAVLLFRFVPVPTTATMLFDGNGAARDWEPLSNISPNLTRAVIAAEDGQFCQHSGFDTQAIEKALNDNPKELEQYFAGKETLLQWFMGQVARATKGKADPNVTKELLAKALEERRK